jgi:ATP-dependent DNA helicase RecQ
MVSDLLSTLQNLFGFDAFRPGQFEAIQSLLSGRHTLVVMPTGSGKSLVYQLAGLYFPGVTLVISPLIALMKDQVDNLTRHGIPAVFINSTLSVDEQNQRLHALAEGAFRLAYVAPERLRSMRFQQVLDGLSISLLAVDEAHCIVQWGHDFRPDYRYIAAALQQMDNPVTVALTATATPRMQEEIVQLLGLPSAERIVTGFDRPNLTFEVLSTRDVAAKLQALRDLLSSLRGGAALVYVATRHDAEEVAEFVREVCGLGALHYHAGLEVEPRTQIQDAFVTGELPIVVATNAFGMGIDRPDVRLVVHFTLPENLETYYQEAGRAGRDGQPARAVLLYAPGDRTLREWFIADSMYTPEDMRKLDHALRKSGRNELWKTTEDLAMAAGLTEVKVRVGLARLEMAGIVRRLGDAGRSMLLRVDEWNDAVVQATSDWATAHRQREEEHLAGMIAYVESTSCRRRLLLDYFGEAATARAAQCCDNCLKRLPAATDSHSVTLSTESNKGLWLGMRGLLTRVAGILATWFAPPVPRDIAAFLTREDPQFLFGPWHVGCTLGYYKRFSGVQSRLTLIGHLVQRLKYWGQAATLPYLVKAVLQVCAEYPDLLDVDALVPVPPSTPRARDPIRAVGEALSQQVGRPVWVVLTKTRWTSTQKGMRTLAQKRANVSGAFAVQADVRGRRLLLLDDFYDSGATLEEATRVLYLAGASRVCVLALARLHHRCV